MPFLHHKLGCPVCYSPFFIITWFINQLKGSVNTNIFAEVTVSKNSEMLICFKSVNSQVQQDALREKFFPLLHSWSHFKLCLSFLILICQTVKVLQFSIFLLNLEPFFPSVLLLCTGAHVCQIQGFLRKCLYSVCFRYLGGLQISTRFHLYFPCHSPCSHLCFFALNYFTFIATILLQNVCKLSCRFISLCSWLTQQPHLNSVSVRW